MYLWGSVPEECSHIRAKYVTHTPPCLLFSPTGSLQTKHRGRERERERWGWIKMGVQNDGEEEEEEEEDMIGYNPLSVFFQTCLYFSLLSLFAHV